MLHGGLQKFFFTVGRYRDRAIHFTWKFTTVYVFARHDDLPGSFTMGVVVVCFKRLVAPRYTVAPAAYRNQVNRRAAAGVRQYIAQTGASG